MDDHYLISRQLNDLGRGELLSLGGALGLHRPKMKRMDDLLGDMVAAWLNAEDNVLRASGPPCWASLVQALEDIQLHGIASNIRR